MKTKSAIFITALLMLVLNGCSTPRKCNGQPGTRVPMGIM
jgi:hypothetical protein